MQIVENIAEHKNINVDYVPVDHGNDSKNNNGVIKEVLLNMIKSISEHFDSIGKKLHDFNRSQTTDTIDSIGELIMHRLLTNELRQLGLRGDWMKLIIAEQKNLMWLKNHRGGYVAINKKMFDTLNVEHYTDILGKTSEHVSGKLTGKIKTFFKQCKTTDELVLGDGITIKRVLDLGKEQITILKYAIKDDEGYVIALLGIAKEVSEDESIQIIEEPEQEIKELLEVVDDLKG